MIRSLALALALLGVLASGAAAQHASVAMRADRTQVERDGLLRLEIRAQIEGEADSGIQAPAFTGFDVVSTQVARPLQLRIGGGGAQHVQSTEVHSYLLRARVEGTHTFAPASIRIGGRVFESEPLTIVVGRGGATGTEPTPSTPVPTPGGASPGSAVDGMVFDADAFIRTWVDEGEPYVGQQITLTVYLYTRRPLRGSPALTREPSTEGFWTHDLLDRTRLTQEQQVMQGVPFYVYKLRQLAAFPLREGELTIGASTIEVTQNDIFDLLRGGGGGSWSRTGVPVTIRARPLPDEGRPPGGEVHVGSLTLSAELDRDQVQTGDAVTLTVVARGRGSLAQLEIPPPSGRDLRVLAPEVRDQIEGANNVLGGSRTSRWLLVPEAPGTYTLGPFEVPVFDPVTERYSMARAPALTLIAAGNAPRGNDDPDATDDDAAPSTSAAEAPSFRPIRTRAALSRSYSSWTGSTWFLALLALGPLALLVALGVKRQRARAGRADPSAAPRRASKAAKQRLREAERHAAANEPRRFYAAVAQSIKEVLEARLGRPVGSLTHPELRELLRARGMDAALADEVIDELEGCDFARFSAAGVSAAEMEACLRRARELLHGLERFTATEEASA